jgi:CRP-like cAMP-binding protein
VTLPRDSGTLPESLNGRPLAAVVERLARRSPLSEADREALLALPHAVKTLGASTHLVRDGDHTESCTALLSGFAYRYKITGEGARQILSIHIAGELVDLQNSFLAVADHSVQMLTDGEVAVIPRQALRDLALGQPGVARSLWIDSLIDASIFREWVVNVGRRNSRARVAHILCELCLRMREAGLIDGPRYELPMSQEQLADAVGLTSVHVNRVLKQLAEEGLIHRDRRSITIDDWIRMKDAGDFNERYLHQDGRQAA